MTRYLLLTRAQDSSWKRDQTWDNFFETFDGEFSIRLRLVGRDMPGGAQLTVEMDDVCLKCGNPEGKHIVLAEWKYAGAPCRFTQSGDELARMLARAGAPALACQKI